MMMIGDHLIERRRRWRDGLALTALCLFFAGLVCIEAAQPTMPAASAVVPPPRPEPAGDGGRSFSMLPLRHYAEVVKRPLFSETRRPARAAAEAAAPDIGVTLVGIVIAKDERRALIAHGRPPRLERIIEGQAVDDWTVEAIQSDRVVLSRGDRRIEVTAKDKASPVIATPRPQSRKANAGINVIPGAPSPPPNSPEVMPGG